MLLLALFAYSASASTAWNSDLDYLAAELPKRHPNPFHDTTAAQFNAALADLKTRTSSLSLAQFAIQLQEIIATLRDAHTEVDTRVSPLAFYPLRIYQFSDGFYVTRTNDESSAACGAQLLSINGVPVEDVHQRVTSVISSENEAWYSARVPAQMMRAEVLIATGVIDSAGPAVFRLQAQSGATIDLALHTVSGQDAADVFGAPYTGADLPLYMQQASKNYWYVWDADRKLLYLKYNVCQDDPGKPLAALASELGAIATQNDVQTFVVDLRNNTGGNSSVLKPIVDGVRANPELRGRIFAIIGRETFSSGMLNAIQLRDAGAILVGEDTGGRPNSYGEVKSMLLPASGLNVFYSTKYFHNSDIDTPSVEPSIRVELDSDDFFMRRDPVLQTIMGRSPIATESATSGRRRAVRPSVLRTCPE